MKVLLLLMMIVIRRKRRGLFVYDYETGHMSCFFCQITKAIKFSFDKITFILLPWATHFYCIEYKKTFFLNICLSVSKMSF